MRRVYLTSGPRGSGKSSYVNSFLERNPGFSLLSRDALLIELFGQTSLNPYSGNQEYAYEVFFGKIKDSIKSSKDIDLIVDCWNGFSTERRSMIKKFREYGADRVICWKFITPIDICLNWFMKKEDSKRYFEHSIRADYDLYHSTSKNIEDDGFDSVCLINPLQLELV